MKWCVIETGEDGTQIVKGPFAHQVAAELYASEHEDFEAGITCQATPIESP